MIRFLADADLNEGIIAGCLRREPAMDFLSARDAKLEGISDPEVLRIAAEQNRILVSHDFRSMPRHFGHFVEMLDSSPGVFLVKQSSPIGPVIAELVLIWTATEHGGMEESDPANSACHNRDALIVQPVQRRFHSCTTIW